MMRVRGKVDEKRRVGDTAALLKVLLEESSSFHVDTHGGKDDREVVLVAVVDTLGSSGPLDQAGLTTDLGGDLRSEYGKRSWRRDRCSPRCAGDQMR
jgi:hypothetical protein